MIPNIYQVNVNVLVAGSINYEVLETIIVEDIETAKYQARLFMKKYLGDAYYHYDEDRIDIDFSMSMNNSWRTYVPVIDEKSNLYMFDILEGFKNVTITGYKAFDIMLRCYDGFQYDYNAEYEIDEEPIPCHRGFHFCNRIIDCYDYYAMNQETRICKVEASGITIIKDNKFCTNHIKILEEVPTMTWIPVWQRKQLLKTPEKYRKNRIIL